MDRRSEVVGRIVCALKRHCSYAKVLPFLAVVWSSLLLRLVSRKVLGHELRHLRWRCFGWFCLAFCVGFGTGLWESFSPPSGSAFLSFPLLSPPPSLGVGWVRFSSSMLLPPGLHRAWAGRSAWLLTSFFFSLLLPLPGPAPLSPLLCSSSGSSSLSPSLSLSLSLLRAWQVLLSGIPCPSRQLTLRR